VRKGLAGADVRILVLAHDPDIGDRLALGREGEPVLAVADGQALDVARDDVLQQTCRVAARHPHESEV
jgi:hypothetical protein